MKRFSLRLRIFFFFSLAALGSVGIFLAALWVGYRQMEQPESASAFITAGIIAAFGIVGLIAYIWLLFDENVSKPVERVAASLRVRSHVNVRFPIDVTSAKYLGDLAPAASAMGTVLDNISKSRAKHEEQLLSDLTAQRDQLVEILSDIPIATILATADHRIALYDGQAACLLERVVAPRLKAPIFDYFDEAPILAALSQIRNTDTARLPITLTAKSGDALSGHIRSFGGRAGYTLMLEPLEPDAARPLTYDFALLTPTSNASVRDTSLHELDFVVFDTETTGLDPAADDVVQLGAVRVVNGKIVPSENFETLVNPNRPIPGRSTDVHGISDAMVKGAPDFGEVAARFHAYAKGAVFVAHNAAFDMAFLHRQAKQTKLKFDQPVLDTVLMSASIFGGSAVHTLDAICERFEIEIPSSLRHTAMGDALATARVLVAMIAIFKGRGIHTFGALETELSRHLRVLKS